MILRALPPAIKKQIRATTLRVSTAAVLEFPRIAIQPPGMTIVLHLLSFVIVWWPLATASFKAGEPLQGRHPPWQPLSQWEAQVVSDG